LVSDAILQLKATEIHFSNNEDFNRSDIFLFAKRSSPEPIIRQFDEERKQLPYDTDGVIFTCDEWELQVKSGTTAKDFVTHIPFSDIFISVWFHGLLNIRDARMKDAQNIVKINPNFLGEFYIGSAEITNMHVLGQSIERSKGGLVTITIDLQIDILIRGADSGQKLRAAELLWDSVLCLAKSHGLADLPLCHRGTKIGQEVCF